MAGPYTSFSENHHVDTFQSATLANCFKSAVVGSGNKHLSLEIELLSVLYVPGFPFNLLCISKITKLLIVLLVFTLFFLSIF